MPRRRQRHWQQGGAPAISVLLLLTAALHITAFKADDIQHAHQHQHHRHRAMQQSSSQDDLGGPGNGSIDASRVVAARHTFDQQWRAKLHRLESVVIDNRRLGDLLGTVLDWKYELPPTQVARSLIYLGPNARLRRVVHDLMVGGKDIHVAAIGGSITAGSKASKIGETDWFSLVMAYLKRAFPRARLTSRNSALSATPSALMNMCLETYVDRQADLVFVEYTANDGVDRYDPVKPKPYEQLLRRLVHYPNAPAVVLMQLMPKGMAFGPHKEKAPYPATLEDMYGALSQYYDLPWLSFRNAAWRLGEFHRYGYNWTDFMWTGDYLHPLDPGMRAIADLAVNLVQKTVTSLLVSPLGPLDHEVLTEKQPPPMHPGNWQARNILCDYGEAFAKHVDASASPGWALVNEGQPSKPKWGFISNQPGAVLRIRVDSRRLYGTPGAATNIMIAYLKSYERMGMAKFECLSGCSCSPVSQVDALHSLQQSTIYLVRLLASQHEQCTIGITVLAQTRSNNHKFKVSGIMVNEYTGADVTTKLHEEQWLTELQSTSAENAKAREDASRAVAAAAAARTAASD